MGGAGNEFFQVARAQSLRTLGFEVELVDPQRIKKLLYKLIGFTYHKPWINISDVTGNLGLRVRNPSGLDYMILAIIFVVRKIGLSAGFNRPLIDIEGRSLRQNFFLKLDVGYFQSNAHLESKSIKTVADAIIHSLDIAPSGSENTMVVHIRGGDVMVENQITDQDVASIVEFCVEKNMVLACVSNDADYVRSKFGSLQYDVMSGGQSAKDDFIHLAGARNMYLSNSTFAFWGAFCARQLSPISVFGPKNWEFSDFIEVRDIRDAT